MGNPSRVGSTPAVCRSGLHALWLPLVGVGSVTRLDHARGESPPRRSLPVVFPHTPPHVAVPQTGWSGTKGPGRESGCPASARLCPCAGMQQYRRWERVALMKKRNATFYPALERPALPVLPARSRFLVRPNC